MALWGTSSSSALIAWIPATAWAPSRPVRMSCPGNPYQFLWSSGGVCIELMIHQIDECFWIKDSWPVSAHGVGGRFAGSTDCSQNLDSYSIEYTFADGTKALVTGRYIPNCHDDFATFVHGTKCAAKVSGDIQI